MNKREEIASLICEISGLNREKADFTNQINLVTDLNMDSIKIVELIVRLEAEYGIEITDRYLDVNVLSDFDNLVALIEKLTETLKGEQ